MKSFFGKFLSSILSKDIGALSPGLIKSTISSTWKSPISAATANSAWKALKLQLYVGVPLSLIAPGTPEEKLKGLGTNLLTAYLTMGMNSPWRQFGWGTAMAIAPNLGNITRGIVQGYRGSLESRTSLAIPFSHSTMAMDQAFATFQYSRQRLSDAYVNIGNEATFFAARYLAR